MGKQESPRLSAGLELVPELKELFRETGYGCVPVESDIGVIHICHATDADIAGFTNKPVWYQWQLIQMPSAPLVRLEIVIVDQPVNPYRFESFLNVGSEDQAHVLSTLANQDSLYLAFYGDALTYTYTKTLPHTEQQWQQLDALIVQATDYWQQLHPDFRDFDRAKARYMALT
jgi:hypothetical protein